MDSWYSIAINHGLVLLSSPVYAKILTYELLQIALKREKMGETAPFWRFSATSYPDLQETVPSDALLGNLTRPLNGNCSTSSSVSTLLLQLVDRGCYFSSLHAWFLLLISYHEGGKYLREYLLLMSDALPNPVDEN